MDKQLKTDAASTWERPENVRFDEWMTTRVARFESRTYDWDALKFQADFPIKSFLTLLPLKLMEPVACAKLPVAAETIANMPRALQRCLTW